ncbi:unnamed protein product, partial [Ectocarpus fasciculatus]
SGGDLDLDGAAPRRRSSPAAAPAAALLAPLRQTAATALAAVLVLASTEQDIMTAMMGLDPSLAPPSTAAQPTMTVPKEEGSQAGGGKAPSMGSIDVRGQGDALGEIAGGPGGGFKNGRLNIAEDSDLAMMLGRKMKTPDAEPLTH